MDNVDNFIGKILDQKYHIKRVIGVGGMAIVFEADDLSTNRKVAVKMLKDEFSKDEQSVKRLIIESKAVSMLSHPNVVKIFDVSVKGELKYIVMERVEGITLKSYMQKKGILSTGEILSYTKQILEALIHVHSKNIVHRDIKPQNILLLKNGEIKLTDFGIAKIPNEEYPITSEKAIGTVYYISPEQASGKIIDQRSDLYSVGVLMYEMATGTLPFNADSPASVIKQQVNEKPTLPSKVVLDLKTGLEQIILGAMEKNPEKRFKSAEQMIKYIKTLEANPDYVFKIQDSVQKNEKIKKQGQNKSLAENMKKGKSKFKKLFDSGTSMLPIILGVSVSFGIVLVISAAVMLNIVLKKENQNSPMTIDVPYVLGEMYDSDINELLDSSYFKIIVNSVYDTSPQNTIIKQEPSAGEKRKVLKNKQYCTITLTVSKGVETVELPDFVAMDYRKAKLEAEKLGLICELKSVSSEIFDVGYVVSTDPVAKTEISTGSKLKIYYSKGASADKVEMPVLTNLTPVEAYTKMNGNFKVGEVTYEYSETVEQGKIISQSIPSGNSVIKGTVIDFVISNGPLITVDPNDPSLEPIEPPIDDPNGEQEGVTP